MIDSATLNKIAKLAKLELSANEQSQFSSQLSKALGYFEQISKINTNEVEPMRTPTEIESYWREDRVENPYTAEEMLANAPDKAGNLFKVPPVV